MVRGAEQKSAFADRQPPRRSDLFMTKNRRLTTRVDPGEIEGIQRL